MRSTSIAIFCGETALYVLRTLGVRHTVAATTPIVIQWKRANDDNWDGLNWFALKIQKYFELVVKPLASVMFGYSSTGNHRLHQSVQILTRHQYHPSCVCHHYLEVQIQTQTNANTHMSPKYHPPTCQDNLTRRCGRLQCCHSQN